MRLSTLSAAAVAFLAASAGAVPTWGKPVPRGATSLDNLATKMPKNTLPAPTGKLKYVLLGLGTQNYTCLTGEPTAEPGTTGALAVLYDIGTRLSVDPMSQYKISTISGLALQFNGNTRALDQYLRSQGYQQVLGEHYFTQTTPTFSLYKVQHDAGSPFPLAMVAKKGEMDAPKTSCPGTKAEGAIKWLYLADEGKGLSVGGIDTVYRLETAGGNKPSVCEGQKQTFEVPYAAQYWVYGPA